FEADNIIAALEESQHPQAELAQRLFIFGFYLGLRRNEIKGLQFKDFHNENNELHTLHVRPNKYRLLKTTDGSRNLPIENLIPATHLEKLLSFVEASKLKHMSFDNLLFHYYTDKDINDAFKLLTDIMKGVTGDETLRFHHCRHSFANWTLCLLY
ncbi:tyrosine-type recombinase/integrase, partial [Vibrio rotiferianus]